MLNILSAHNVLLWHCNGHPPVNYWFCITCDSHLLQDDIRGKSHLWHVSRFLPEFAWMDWGTPWIMSEDHSCHIHDSFGTSQTQDSKVIVWVHLLSLSLQLLIFRRHNLKMDTLSNKELTFIGDTKCLQRKWIQQFYTEQVGSSDDTSNLHLESAWFESKPGHQLFCLRFVAVFSVPPG